MSQDMSYDAIIVGGGLAGLVAGLRISEAGLKVVVIEKGTTPDYVCNSRYSGGIFHVAYADPKGSPADIETALNRIPFDEADPELSRVLVARANELVDWLRGMGVKFIRGGNRASGGWMLSPPRPLIGGLNHEGRGPDLLLRRLTRMIESAGGELKLGHRATSLVREQGACCGVVVDTAEGEKTLRAEAIVLCDGGFQANLDMIRGVISPAPEKIRQRGGATSMGDALNMARLAGAASTGLGGFYGHLLSRDAFVRDKLWPYPQLDEIAGAGIVVDARGDRILDEGSGGIFLANRIAARPDPLDTSVICDSAIWEGAGSKARIPPNPHLEKGGGTLHRADTIEDLAGIAGFDPAVLAETVKSYNAALRSGGLGSLVPPRTNVWYEPMLIEKAPFYAIPACAGITYTMGGIRIDGRARVLDTSGIPVPGLYAAGSATGGFEGGDKVRYVGGLSRAGLFGIIAAEEIAALAGRGAG